MAERCLFPASLQVRAAFFRRAAAKTFPATAHRRRHGKPQDAGKFPAGLGNLAQVDPCEITSTFNLNLLVLSGLGNFAARRQTAARRRHQRPAANARRAFRTTQNLKSQISNSSSLASPRCCKKPFAPDDLQNRTRRFERGDKIAPLDLIEFLEEQGYEPEAQVSQKGEIALRGGILDVFPPTSPWPVRLEFFGDELESLRHFDPLTQISREEISRSHLAARRRTGNPKNGSPERPKPNVRTAPQLATLLDHLPRETIFILCEPESLAVHADDYAQQIPAGRSVFHFVAGFFDRIEPPQISLRLNWLNEAGTGEANPAIRQSAIRNLTRSTPSVRWPNARRNRKLPRRSAANFSSSFIAGCGRIMPSTFFATTTASASGLRKSGRNYGFGCVEDRNRSKMPSIHIGSLARGFICDEAKLVVVTDAEIFGRYKIQRPRRLKSPHALAARSALDIDFTDLEEGD